LGVVALELARAQGEAEAGALAKLEEMLKNKAR
jgi:hypothetical protein